MTLEDVIDVAAQAVYESERDQYFNKVLPPWENIDPFVQLHFRDRVRPIVVTVQALVRLGQVQ